MSLPKIEVEIRPTDRTGVTKGHADVKLLLTNGEILLIGFAIIEKPGHKPFIGFPANRGRDKFFPVVEAKGELREAITKAILRAYRDSSGAKKVPGPSAGSSAGSDLHPSVIPRRCTARSAQEPECGDRIQRGEVKSASRVEDLDDDWYLG